VINERQQDIQTEIIGGLDLLAHVATTARNRIYSLQPRLAWKGEEDTDTSLGQELDEALEHVIAVGVTVVVDIQVNHEAGMTGNLV
jgi:hypothetical protein